MAKETKIKEDTVTVPVAQGDLDATSNAEFYNPHGFPGGHLGIGKHADTATIRVLRPLAKSVTILTQDGEYPMTHEYNGVFVVTVPASGTKKQPTIPDYRVRTEWESGAVLIEDDPYRYMPTVGDMDTYLFGEGRHEKLWETLGAHVLRYDDPMGGADGTPGEQVVGTAFSVWAPNAHAVRVVGNFNAWDGRRHAMRELGSSGVWEIFVPEVGVGARYKFEIQGPGGNWFQKADPLARATEIPPATASVVTDYFHEWTDDEWMSTRKDRNPHAGPMSIYEVHAGSWRQGLGYRELADELVPYVKQMGFTHVEFMPLAEHPFGGSWGYQVTSYYAPTSRYGTPDDFRYLVDAFHRAGIGVILDWVPAHFPKDDFALARFDGTPLYEDPDPLRGEHPDWGTYVFNFGRREVRNFLVANALYWLEDFHIDGLRVDAVASMLYLDYSRKDGQWRPNQYGGRENLEAIEFIQEANATAYRRHPGIVMIAEESTAWPGVTAPTSGGGLGYGMKWNMGWMNDTLRYLSEDPVNRRWHHGELTFSLVYAFSENYVLPLSHDEVVHGKGSLISKMPGDKWQRLAGLRSLYAYQWSHPGKQLLFMGQEIGQEQEWNESYSLDWWLLDQEGHAGVAALVERLNAIYASSPAMWDDDYTGFEWIDASDGDHNLISYLRKGSDDAGNREVVVCISNFAGNPHEGYRVGLPFGGEWVEILNTDAEEFGGSGVVNVGTIIAEDTPWNGRPVSASLRVPPLGAVWLVPASQVR